MPKAPNNRSEKFAAGANRKIAKTATYYAGLLCLGLVVSVLGPSLPGLARNTGTSLSEISFLFTSVSLGYLLGSLLGGRLFDRVPGHPLLSVSVFTMCAVMGAVPLISVFYLLAGVFFILGIAQAFLDVGTNTLLVWVHRDRVGPYMNGLHFFFGFGALLAPLLVGQSIRISQNIKWAYWVLALVMIPVAVVLLRFPSPSAPARTEFNTAGKTSPLLVALISA
ncbi:MAG: MFS transporter, partial [Spirochaetota bacterium]